MLFLAEVGIFILAAISFRQAYLKNKGVLFLFLVFDAWLFEWVILALLKELNYNSDFAISLLGIPLIVILGWVILLYSLQNLFANTRNIFLKALTSAVLMSGLDLILDVIAVHYGMWQWKSPGGYFGIPYNNFFGWFLYSFLVSLSISLFLKTGNWKDYLKMLIFITIPGLTLGGIWYLIPESFQTFLWWGLYISSLIYIFINTYKLKIDLKLNSILPLIFFSLFCVGGIIISFNYYPLAYILNSFVVAVLLFLIITGPQIYRHYYNLRSSLVKKSS